MFNTSTGLLCRHIFAVRSHKGIALFDLDIVPCRWTRNCYAEHQQAVNESDVPQSTQVGLATVTRSSILTAHQKLCISSIVATLVTEAPMRHFDYRIVQMHALCNVWKADRETAVQSLN